MKLLTRTLIYFLLISIPTFVLGSFAFYFFLKYAMIQQVDESLKTDKQEIIDFVNNNKNDVSELYKAISCTYFLVPDSVYEPRKEVFSFISEYDSLDMDYKPFRQLKTSIQIKTDHYQLVMRESLVDSDSLIYSILFFAIVLLAMLTIGIALLNWFISKRIWNPFYQLLAIISNFKPGKDVKTEIKSNNIQEFGSLNIAIGKMINRINKDFNKQKKFIDNIAHELQTPLAIANSQLELFMQDSSLNEKTANMIDGLDKTLLKMKNMNQSLLLLSRIQNEQFNESKIIELDNIIIEYLKIYQDQIQIMNITIDISSLKAISINMNEALSNILIGNLLSNALKHNVLDGYIRIASTIKTMTIENSGHELNMDTEELFSPYVSRSNNSDSLGMGLSIIKEICNYYNFNVEYSLKQNIHKIQITFN
nr:HAMP domain-containing sensor histidine kinase [uncultured Carboxylicivirga sp.]